MSNVVELRTREPSTDASVTEPYLVFANPGSLEINLVKLLGVSVKESSDPIGFFGTGLKYAMATALRLGGSMTIITDGQRYDVVGRAIKLRDKEFVQVMLNDEPLGFTTELGKQWEPWMVVRELYSNSLDESGDTSVAHGELDNIRQDGRTVIVLRGDCFLDVWNSRHSYFLALDSERPLHHSTHIDAYDPQGHNHAVFYRGIKIHDSQWPTLYRYNILDTVTLTEDRTLKYTFQLNEAMEKAIITSKDAAFIAASLTTGDSFREGKLDFSSGHTSCVMSDEFRSVCAHLNHRQPENLNKSAIRFYKARTQFSEPLVICKLTKVQQMQMDKATAFLQRIGLEDDLKEYPIEVVTWLGENVYGKAEDERIYLSKDCFDKGTKFLASTILEEFVHCHYSLNDESRALQTFLFDRIISMGEEYVTGEPL